MKNKIFKYIFTFFIFCFVVSVHAQENKSEADKKGTSIKSEREKRRSDRKKWKEERRRKRAEERMIRNHHKRIQTKEVNKRMRRSQRKAKRINENKREFFLIRWFSRKK